MLKIIVEGIDNVGKSTIAGRLAKHYRLPLYHAERLDRDHMMRIVTDDIIKCGLMDKGIIFDRYYTSDIVYEPLMKHQPSPLAEHMDVLLSRLDEMEFIYITLVCTPAVTIQRYEELGDELQSLNTILAAADGYKKLHRLMSCNKILFDVSERDVDSNVRILIELIDQLKTERGIE